MSAAVSSHSISIASPYGVGNDTGSWVMSCTCGARKERSTCHAANMASLAHDIQVQEATRLAVHNS